MVTLPSQQGNLLVAFLALFISLAGNVLWGLLCYAIHQARASRRRRDALHHQTQAVLRNASTPSSLLYFVLFASLSWRRRASAPGRRLTQFALIAVVHLFAFIAAGVFSSSLAIDNGPQLLQNTHCGFARHRHGSDDDVQEAHAETVSDVEMREDYEASMDYAKTCYSGPQSQPASCGIFFKSTMIYTVK